MGFKTTGCGPAGKAASISMICLLLLLQPLQVLAAVDPNDFKCTTMNQTGTFHDVAGIAMGPWGQHVVFTDYTTCAIYTARADGNRAEVQVSGDYTCHNVPGTGAGSGGAGWWRPVDIVHDPSRNVFWSTAGNLVRKMTDSTSGTPYQVTDECGAVAGTTGDPGSGDGLCSDTVNTQFNEPNGLALDSTGSTLYIADKLNHRIRRIVLSTMTASIFVGTSVGTADGIWTAAQFNNPQGITITDDDLSMFVSDTGNSLLRRVDMATWTVSLWAGVVGKTGTVDGEALTVARLDDPDSIVVAPKNLWHHVVYFTQRLQHIIRSVHQGYVKTILGKAYWDGLTDGIGALCRLTHPKGLALSSDGYTLYIGGYALIKVDITHVNSTSSNASHPVHYSTCNSPNASGSTFEASSGMIGSDADLNGNGTSYAASQICWWSIRCPSGDYVDFTLNGSTYNSSDLVAVKAVDTSTDTTFHGGFTGTTVSSLSTSIVVTFTTDASSKTVGAGWSLSWSCNPPPVPVPEPYTGPYSGSCLETCCCKVCSAPGNEAYPYGLTTVPIQENPDFPTVAGSACHFSIWSDNPMNDTNGNPQVVPDKLFWTDFSVFGDTVTHAAGPSCSCCQLSVDTSCAEAAPAATRPTQFYVEGGKPIEYLPGQIHLEKGVELTVNDYIELRNDTFCGYTHPMYVQRSNMSELSVKLFKVGTSLQTITWNIPRLPPRGCYRVCYYHSSLTTTTWYDMGVVNVFHSANPTSEVTANVNALDIPLEQNEVVITFTGLELLSVFDDEAELRTSGACGSGSPTTTTATTTNGILHITENHEWCKPAVVPAVTSVRPLRYITPVYQDCVEYNRLYQDRTQWVLTLPAAATYTVCYRSNLTWYSLAQQLTVLPQQTAAAALNNFYAYTGGATTWTRNTGWGGTNACLFYGVRCNAGGDVVGIHLSRNNVAGSFPPDMFEAAFFLTLEHIALDENALRGSIPYSIGVLRNLKYLSLGVNMLSGQLPLSLQRTSLLQFYAPMNSFIGEVPVDLQAMSMLWTHFNNITAPVVEPSTTRCPYDPMQCSDKGSTDVGVFECGYSSITEAECLARECCFNSQAPLVFGGTSCFTKRSLFEDTNPTCTDGIECQTIPIVVV